MPFETDVMIALSKIHERMDALEKRVFGSVGTDAMARGGFQLAHIAIHLLVRAGVPASDIREIISGIIAEGESGGALPAAAGAEMDRVMRALKDKEK